MHKYRNVLWLARRSRSAKAGPFSQTMGLLLFWAMLVLNGLVGCGGSDQLPTGPVEGKVFYQGKPLEFGSVLFQPKAGPPGRGQIQPDGSFVISTYGNGDGAILGLNKVRISCSETQDPNYQQVPTEGEMAVGKSLIPKKYTRAETSGIEVDVKEENNPLTFKLTD